MATLARGGRRRCDVGKTGAAGWGSVPPSTSDGPATSLAPGRLRVRTTLSLVIGSSRMTVSVPVSECRVFRPEQACLNAPVNEMATTRPSGTSVLLPRSRFARRRRNRARSRIKTERTKEILLSPLLILIALERPRSPLRLLANTIGITG
jgi:hypothetical protein